MNSLIDVPPIAPTEAAVLAEKIILKLENAANSGATTVFTRLVRGDFELEGLQFKFTQETATDGSNLTFSAPLGYIPYTVEAKERRYALQRIIQASPKLPHARIKLDKHGAMVLHSKAHLMPEANDTDAMLALLAFYQEIGPLLRLMAKYL